jgi:hypothetical protein
MFLHLLKPRFPSPRRRRRRGRRRRLHSSRTTDRARGPHLGHL